MNGGKYKILGVGTMKKGKMKIWPEGLNAKKEISRQNPISIRTQTTRSIYIFTTFCKGGIIFLGLLMLFGLE